MADFLSWLTSDDVYPWVMGMLGLLVLSLFRLWALVRRLRGDGLVLAVDDPTPDGPDDLMALADALAEPEPVLVIDPPTVPPYTPCTTTWETGEGTHRCRQTGVCQVHLCRCGARSLGDAPELPPVEEDPVAIRLGIVPDPWVTFGDVRVHRQCMDWRRDGKHQLIVDGCRPHLVGAASDLPSGGAT